MHGLPACGKSTTAESLSKYLNLPKISTFDIRNRDLQLEPNVLKTRIKMSKMVYARLANYASSLMRESVNLLVDGTFSYYWQREIFYKIIKKYSYSVILIKCSCPEDIALKRVKNDIHSGRTESESRNSKDYFYIKETIEDYALDPELDGIDFGLIEFNSHSFEGVLYNRTDVTLTKVAYFLQKYSNERLHSKGIVEYSRFGGESPNHGMNSD